jgi:hypothetical protein
LVVVAQFLPKEVILLLFHIVLLEEEGALHTLESLAQAVVVAVLSARV